MNRVMIVTGGSRGIGAATARLAATRGYAVCVNYRKDRDAADAIVEEIEANGGNAIAVAADVSSESDVDNLFKAVDARLGVVTALVNNAGILEKQLRLTVEKIRAGNSNIRNPILVSYVAKGLLPYHGLGSGIKRALEKWPAIDFTDDHDGCLFTAMVHRKPVEELDLADKGALTGQVAGLSGQIDPINDLLNALRTDPSAGYAALAKRLEVSEATIKRNIQKLKRQNRIRRIGSKKTGRWEVIE